MNPQLIKLCMEKGLLLDKEAYNMLSEFKEEEVNKIIEKISLLKEKFITKSFLNQNFEKISSSLKDEKVIEKVKINLGVSLEITKERYIEKNLQKHFDNLKVIYSLANLTRKIEPNDFVVHLRNRFNEIRRILLERKELENICSINKLSDEKQNVSVIGMVYNKRVTKNKNIILEIEDSTGKVGVLINKDKADLMNIAKDIIIDDIIAVKGMGNRELIFTNGIYYPEAFLQEKNALSKEEYIAFISDIHVGSKMFFKENFEKFILWINGEYGDEKTRQEAKKVKYLLITGDTVDGVGIFPGQEELLNIKDIKEQYSELANYLGRIRKDVKMVLCPGQHDSVRVAEPQPFVGRDFAEPLYALDNLILVSNPAVVEIGNETKKGIKIMMYHGASMTSFVNEIESLRFSKAHDTPSKVVKQMLKRRHLATIHSAVTYIPTEKEDPLVIKEVPDIMVTADFHRADIDLYNNILIICNSCWQGLTPFEEKVGNHPDPCKVPVLNLRTREIKILDFSDKQEEKQCEEKEGGIVCELKK